MYCVYSAVKNIINCYLKKKMRKYTIPEEKAVQASYIIIIIHIYYLHNNPFKATPVHTN